MSQNSERVMEDLVSLRKQRTILKRAFTRMHTFCTQPNVQIEDLAVRVERSKELLRSYQDIQNKIDVLVGDDDRQLELEEQYRADIEEVCLNLNAIHRRAYNMRNTETEHTETQENSNMVRAVEALVQHQASMSVLMERFANVRAENTSTPIVQQTQQYQCELKLPPIQLPDFSGNLLEWVRFRDLFEALVHTKTNITNVEKLEYLHTRLKGEALLTIKHLKPMNSNYEVAWGLLKSKYDNVEKIKHTYMELLVDQAVMKSSSLNEVKRMHNGISEGYNALMALDSTVEHWDSVLLYNIEKKLDNTTAALWFREKKHDQPSNFKQFIEFLEKRIMELESIQNNSQHSQSYREQKRPSARTYTANLQSCPVCTQHHYLFQCTEFKSMNVNERRQIAQKSNVCFNCLRNNHRVQECKSSSCRQCNKKHNTLLHINDRSETLGRSQSNPTVAQESNSHIVYNQAITTPVHNNNEINIQNTQDVISNTSQTHNNSYIMLPTAVIEVIDNCGIGQKCRALLDSGSQGTFITEASVQRLGLKKQFDKTVIHGLGKNNGIYAKGRVTLNIVNKMNNNLINTYALCLSNLTQILPSHQIEKDKFNYFNKLQMADPQFHKPANIDIILGADVFMQCCLQQTLVHPTGSPIALNTVFGWVLMGGVNHTTSNVILSNHISTDLHQTLQKFWELENIPENSPQISPEDKAAEEYYKSTTQRHVNGRYIVRLPLKSELNIGDSKANALKRLHTMERKFKQNNQVASDYKAFMNEYINLGHMETIDETQVSRQMCYLPHHAVIKSSSSTSKLRVVFDASIKTTNGRSLNDNLLVGPKIQTELFNMLIDFRLYRVAIVADIEKMYRQILMNDDDKHMQCILWRNSEYENVKTYTLNTITYGTASAPFLAIRTLHKIADDNSQLYPIIATALRNNFYVDDFMYCTERLQDAVKVKTDLCKILESAGLHLRKWCSNSLSFMDTVTIEDRAESLDTNIQHSSTVSTLGILWDTKNDVFKYSISFTQITQPITKRVVLSEIAKLFDPLGWIAPVIVQLKIFMQSLWLSGLNWDEQLSPELLNLWTNLHNSLKSITNITIPRWIQYTSDAKMELHGFSDASERAYAAAVYIKITTPNGDIFTHLLTSKTRVSPIKQISLPRLELCAAHSLTKLLVSVRNSLKKHDIPIYAWTDSMIVLYWISDHPCRWTTFIANRASAIIDVIPAQQWYHIKSNSNPADLATRGIHPEKLINNKLWWHGPDEIREQHLPTCKIIDVPNTPHLEERRKVNVNTIVLEQPEIIKRYSSLTKLIRITALLKRFINNCKDKKNKIIGFITVIELRESHLILIKLSQQAFFQEEINIIRSGRQLSAKHYLSSLTPFLDKNGVLRVGGRLINANIAYDQMHPIILHKKQELTQLIVRYYHLQHCHAGKRLLYYFIHLKYWIKSSIHIIKQTIYKCPTCMRYRAKPYEQQMGNIPKHRIIPAPAFINVGIDFAGPFQVLAWKGRGNKLHKCWISIFVCLATKAIHIELVSELSSDAFIAALRRFISRHSRPLHIYTDNGTNFVGANHYLIEIYNSLKEKNKQEAIHKYLADQEVEWHFSPPSGPHFGGIWEASVKSVKYHLKRVLKDARPTFEEMGTILCQIEGCLNSRPLCIKFEGDMDPLTPAHFLLLRPLTCIPDENYLDKKENYLSRWQYTQRLVQQFWRKWSNEYLHQLQQRPKWKKKLDNISENDIVLIKDDNQPPSNWLLGKIIQLHPGTDGLVRVATVKTSTGLLKRPIVKLCPLLINC